jgi:hypothetical protein
LGCPWLRGRPSVRAWRRGLTFVPVHDGLPCHAEQGSI